VIHLTNFHSTAKLYSTGDCNSHQSRPEKKKICENWYALQYFSLPHPAHVVQRRNARGRTGSVTRSMKCKNKGRLAAWYSYLPHASRFTKARARQVLYIQALHSRTACCLLAASLQPRSTHSRSAAAVHPVPYVYDVSRLVAVGFYATLWYSYL